MDPKSLATGVVSTVIAALLLQLYLDLRDDARDLDEFEGETSTELAQIKSKTDSIDVLQAQIMPREVIEARSAVTEERMARIDDELVRLRKRLEQLADKYVEQLEDQVFDGR